MGWKTGLPHCWPYDNSRSTSHSSGHNGPSSEGKRARTSMCKSASPAALQVWPSKRFPIKDTSGDGGSNCQPSPHWPSRGQDCNRHWRDQRPLSPQFPSPSLDWGFESDRSSLSMASSMSSRSDRSDRSQYSQKGRQHWEDRAHMKINLPVFKDEDAKDAVTYQSWRWDLTVYHHVGCRACTLLPYAIWSLQGYPGELM